MPSPRLFPMLAPILVLALALVSTPALSQDLTLLPDDFGANPGALQMFLHSPADAGTTPLPLIVALHGCTMQAADFDDETGLLGLADTLPALVLLPQQTSDNNPRLCFNFFARADNRAGMGESGSIRAAIDYVRSTHPVDPDRIYVLGLSAGGGMTSVMVANYPDLFAGAAILAGLPYGCNTASWFHTGFWWRTWTGGEGIAALYACGIGIKGISDAARPIDRDPEDWAALLPGPAPSRTRLSLWQGDQDKTVHPDNLRELTEQWTEAMGLDRAAAEVTNLPDGVTRTVYTDATGIPRVEAFALPALAHDVPVDPANACGTDRATPEDHMSDQRLCAIRAAAAFWGLTEAPQ